MAKTNIVKKLDKLFFIYPRRRNPTCTHIFLMGLSSGM